METEDTPPPRHGVRFEWSLNLGHVCQIITVAAGGLGVAWSVMTSFASFERELASHETRISIIERTRASDTVELLAFQKEMRDAVTAIKEAVGEIKGQLKAPTYR